LAVLVADVAEPRAARHVLAAFDPAVHVEPAPAATAAGAGNTGRLLVFLGAFGEDPLLLPDGNAPCMLTAEPAVAGTCAGVLATRKGAHADAGPPAAACKRRARKHLLCACCDCGRELLDEIVQQAVDGFGHVRPVRKRGSKSGRWGSFSSRFDNELLEP